MHDELDPGIRLLFEEQDRGLAEEPFLGNTLQCLKKRQARQDFLHKTLLVLALACCALLSPLFVRASIWVSESVARGFGYLESFLVMPAGIFTAALCGLLLIILGGRRLIFTLVRQA